MHFSNGRHFRLFRKTTCTLKHYHLHIVRLPKQNFSALSQTQTLFLRDVKTIGNSRTSYIHVIYRNFMCDVCTYYMCVFKPHKPLFIMQNDSLPYTYIFIYIYHLRFYSSTYLPIYLSIVYLHMLFCSKIFKVRNK